MQGVFRVAVRAAFEEVTAARLVRDERRHKGMEVVLSFAEVVVVQTATWRIDSEETVGGAVCSVRPRKLDCVVVTSGSRCSGIRASAQERRKWRREKGKPCIAVGSDG